MSSSRCAAPFGSGGEFSPFDERTDGMATLRWIRGSPLGRVGRIGPSYLGLVQWAIADEVDAMAPSITASQFRDMAMGSGALGLDTAMSWLLLLDVQEAQAAPLLMARGLRGLEDVWDHLPLGEIDERALGGPRRSGASGSSTWRPQPVLGHARLLVQGRRRRGARAARRRLERHVPALAHRGLARACAPRAASRSSSSGPARTSPPC